MSNFVRRRAGAVIVLGLSALIIQIPVEANETELEPVIVTATRSAQSNNPTASAVTVITREMIAASGADRIDQVLRSATGVQLSDLYGDGSRTLVSVRGFGETAVSNVLILVDGRRLNNPDIAAPDLSSVALKDVERIEILQGSAGSLYGDQAVGGVINIITRTPQAFSGDVAGSLGSYDNRAIVARISDKLANGFNYRLTSEKRKSDNYRDNNDLDVGNILGRMGYDYRSGSVFVEALQTDEDVRLPGGLFKPQYETNRRAARFPNDFSDTNTDVQRIGVRQSLDATWVVEAEASNRNTDVHGVLSDTSFKQSRDVRELTPRVVGRIPTGSGAVQVTAGTDINDSDYRISSTFGLTKNNQTMRAYYTQLLLPLGSPRQTLTLGGRHARVENDLHDSFTYPNGIKLDDDVNVIEIGLLMQVTETWRLFARRDENYRFPKVDEMTATLGGVVQLKTQTGVSYELGAEWAHQRSRFKAMLYRLDLTDEITYDVATYANVNLDPTRRDGFLLEALYGLTPTVDVGGNISLVDATFRDGTYAGNRVPFVAAHMANLNTTWRFANHWSLFAEAQYISDRYAAGDIANDLEQLDGYIVANTALRYEQKHWVADVRVNNIANKEYADFAASSYNPATFANETAFYASPERNWQASLRYRF